MATDSVKVSGNYKLTYAISRIRSVADTCSTNLHLEYRIGLARLSDAVDVTQCVS
jgi:hypothetical protein